VAITKYIKSYKDLVTSDSLTRAGFLEQAIRKYKEAIPYVDSAKLLLDKIQAVRNPQDLLEIDKLRDDLITAAGFSDKATAFFSRDQLKTALSEILDKMASVPGSDWRNEVIYRFLLTRGDSLGGRMRNIMGSIAKDMFTEAVLAALSAQEIAPEVGYNEEGKVVQIFWPKRTLVFDRTPKLIAKNVDAILLRHDDPSVEMKELFKVESNYIVCGEIKGGIDPAGSDEHWKTAQGAFGTIREKLHGKPKLFFVGAAIVKSVGQKIWQQLKSGKLTYAANLTVPSQLSDLASWLVSC
jgi:hypothetical protein